MVVDDDLELGALLVSYLGEHGFQTSTAETGAALESALGVGPVDLILLDLGLPDEDGLILLRRLQERHIPVIVISGRGETIERVVGLELGADDYVSKPFEFRELLARIRCVMRRTRSDASKAVQEPPRQVTFDGLRLDLLTRRLIDRLGDSTVLTSGEFELLRILLDHPNQVLTRDQLMNCLHGRYPGPFDRTIDVQIGRLRRKVENDPVHPQLIQSVRGAGYVLATTVQRS